ncbi:MAG: MotA/TolQ/ExbB proton channel family protein [Myxococcota bacterium]
MTFDWGEMWAHMGLVARGVLLTLVVMSIWSAGVALERLMRLGSAVRQSTAFGDQARAWMAGRSFRDVVGAREQYPQSPLCMVVSSAVREYHDGVAARENGATYDVIEAAERAVDRTIEMELARLRKGLGALASISSSAPFVGLFGTTFGIINSFQAIGQSGQGDLATVAPGIAEALVTTAFGIFVALPAVWLFNYFTGRVDALGVDLRNAGNEVVDFLIKDLGRGGERKSA